MHKRRPKENLTSTKIKLLLTSFTLLLLLSCAFAWAFGLKHNANELAPAFDLIILHTNDIHAHDLPFMDRAKQVGGMAKIGELISSIRKEHDNVLVVDAGDFFQGTPLFQRYGGDVEIELLNKIGYDIVELGNHEFDRGAIYLAEHLKQAKFPVLACNIDCSAVPALKNIVRPAIVEEIAGQKVAFIGVITPDLETKVLSLNGVKVESPNGDWLAPIGREIERYERDGINKIILVSHCGVELDKQIAQTYPRVDLIIGGHSHTRLAQPVWIQHPDGTYTAIVQTGCYGRALGEIDLKFDQQGHLLKPDTKYHLISITEDLPADPELTKYIDQKEEPLLAMQKK